ncbi:hypothetical protein ACPV5R_18585 [Vibrio astriarenae]
MVEWNHTEESRRANTPIASRLYSRATIFHPSKTPTTAMIQRLAEVPEYDPFNPLISSQFAYDNIDYRVDLHNHFMLQTHRDVLEGILAFGDTVKVDDVVEGAVYTWGSVVKSVKNIDVNLESLASNARIPSESLVLSVGFYKLAKSLGLSPNRSNYNSIMTKVAQLENVKLSINALDNDGNPVSQHQTSFFSNTLFCCDRTKLKSNSKKESINHVLVVVHEDFLSLMSEARYFRRLDQFKMANYSKPSVRSFIKFVTTNKNQFLHKKRLLWVVDYYLSSMIFDVSTNFRRTLINELIADKDQLAFDFGFIIVGDNDDATISIDKVVWGAEE